MIPRIVEPLQLLPTKAGGHVPMERLRNNAASNYLLRPIPELVTTDLVEEYWNCTQAFNNGVNRLLMPGVNLDDTVRLAQKTFVIAEVTAVRIEAQIMAALASLNVMPIP